MRVELGDLWDAPDGSLVCIPTNSVVYTDKDCHRKLVMGAGIAKDAVCRHGDRVAQHFGEWVDGSGNAPCILYQDPYSLASFPTKADWRKGSILWLIEQSAEFIATTHEFSKFTEIRMPAVGCGLGGLKLDDVLRVLCKHFTSDRYVMLLEA